MAERCDCGWDFAAREVRTSYLVGNPRRSINLASLGPRLCGHITDSFAILLIMVVSVLPSAVSEAVGAATLMGGALLALSYALLADGLAGGQSLGKRIARIAVVDATNGNPCTFSQSAARNALRILGIVDWAFVLGEKRQRLGDKVANTIVVNVAPAAATRKPHRRAAAVSRADQTGQWPRSGALRVS